MIFVPCIETMQFNSLRISIKERKYVIGILSFYTIGLR